MSEMQEELQNLTMDDLTFAGERLYVAALRYARAFERCELDQELASDHGKMPIGPAAAGLSEATGRYNEAYGRCEATGFFDA